MAQESMLGSWDYSSLPKLLATIEVLNNIDIHVKLTHSQRNRLSFSRALVMGELTSLLITAAKPDGDFLLQGLSQGKNVLATDDIPF